MKWSEFKAEVEKLLGPNRNRMGAEELVPAQITQAIIDCQYKVEALRYGHESLFTAASVTDSGKASFGTIPNDIRIREIWLSREESGSVVEREARLVSWKSRVAMVNGTACLNDGNPLIAISPTRTQFAVYPALRYAGGDPSGSNLIPDGALYAGFIYTPENPPAAYEDGLYDVPVVAGNTYRWIKGSADSKLLNGASYAAQNENFVAASSSVRLYGDLGLAVTAQIYLIATDDKPSVDDELQLIWDGVRTDFSDGDNVPFNLAAAGAVASWVNAQCAGQLDNDEPRAAKLMRDYNRAVRRMRTEFAR